MRAVINPGELEEPHAHIIKKDNNIGRIFSDGSMDDSLLSNREGRNFTKDNNLDIMDLKENFYGKR